MRCARLLAPLAGLLLCLGASGAEKAPEGLALLFNLRFAEAEKAFTAAATAAPEDLEPRYRLAAAAFGEVLFAGTGEVRLEKLRLRCGEASDLALTALLNKPDPKTTLYAGAIFLLQAAADSLEERQGSALAWGRRAAAQFQKVARDPDWGPSARMLAAACNISAGTAPWSTALCLSWIMQPRDPNAGLAEIEEELESAPLFSLEMRCFLVWAYCREGMPRQAGRHVAKLEELVGKNPLTELAAIQAALGAGKTAEARELGVRLHQACLKRRDWRPMAPDAACAAGLAALRGMELSTAEQWFSKCHETGAEKPRLQALSLLFLGECADLKGEREEALRRYARVHMSKGAGDFLKRRASQLEKNPCKPQNRL